MASQPTPFPQASFGDAKSHGRAFLQSTIGAHPVAAAVTMGVLVLLVIVLGFYVAHYKAKASAATKSGFADYAGQGYTPSQGRYLGGMSAGGSAPGSTSVYAHNPPTPAAVTSAQQWQQPCGAWPLEVTEQIASLQAAGGMAMLPTPLAEDTLYAQQALAQNDKYYMYTAPSSVGQPFTPMTDDVLPTTPYQQTGPMVSRGFPN